MIVHGPGLEPDLLWLRPPDNKLSGPPNLTPCRLLVYIDPQRPSVTGELRRFEILEHRFRSMSQRVSEIRVAWASPRPRDYFRGSRSRVPRALSRIGGDWTERNVSDSPSVRTPWKTPLP